jgi:26S proteasome regulatory subunit N1
MEAVRTLAHAPTAKFAAAMLEACAFAGTGNVLIVQRMMHVCAEHLEGEAAHQMAAVLGIALITLGESVGSEMSERALNHLLQYGELPVRRAVPLAFALLHVSDPDYACVDTLSKLSHDADAEVAMNAIVGLGLCSAGTNNSRVAGLLRQLSVFYAKEPNPLFMVRLAQGLLHMGKGLLTLAPQHSDRLLLSKPALAGLVTLATLCFDTPNTILGKFHYLVYAVAPAIRMRSLICVDAAGAARPVTVRVGTAVDTVGVAGRPKSITGFQTHASPVLLNQKDRAELATDEHAALTTVLEGFVVVRPAEGGAKEGGAGAKAAAAPAAAAAAAASAGVESKVPVA